MENKIIVNLICQECNSHIVELGIFRPDWISKINIMEYINIMARCPRCGSIYKSVTIRPFSEIGIVPSVKDWRKPLKGTVRVVEGTIEPPPR